jgi:dTDP-4-amino-4,6-dideoxygalactose transaminase
MTTSDAVPLIDLRRSLDSYRSGANRAFTRVLESQQFILGEEVAAFEREFAAWLGVEEAVGCGSGSDAIALALQALDVGRGDEVVTTPFTFIATVSAIVRVGAQPVLVDVDPQTDPQTLCPAADATAAALTPRTRAVIPVHLYGQSADLGPVLAATEPRGIAVVEDAAQALGARFGKRPVGAVGALGCHSFFPTKNLGGLGDGGAITTDRPELAARLRKLRDHGARRRYDYDEVGINSRLDAVQAACLRVKLPLVSGWVEERRTAAARYRELLAPLEAAGLLRLPVEAGYGRHSYNLFTVRVDDRDRVAAGLHESGIGNAVHYPIPLHLQPCFAGLGHRSGDFPEAEAAAREVLSLPLFPGITDAEQVRVSEALHRILGSA